LDGIVNGAPTHPFSPVQLRSIVEILRAVPSCCLQSIIKANPIAGGPPPTRKGLALQCADQLVEQLPVIAICLKRGASGTLAQNIMILGIEAAGAREGSPYFLSLLHMASTHGRMRAPEETFDFEMAPAPTDSEGDCMGLGRLALEAKYGEELVEFLRTFIYSKGQVGIESHRLKSTGQVYGAPLRAMAAAAQAAGFPVSYSGIYNLMVAPRRNSTSSSCRGVIDARPAHIEAVSKLWHPGGIETPR
jgi:hypothetical protein